MMRNCGKQRDRDGDILLVPQVRNIDACMYTCIHNTRTVPVFTIRCTTVQAHSIRFEDHKDEGRSREVGISGPPHAAMVQASEWRSG